MIIAPTWNYAVVHAHGTPRIADDPQALRAQQKRLVTANEAGQSPSWNMDRRAPLARRKRAPGSKQT